MHQLAQHSVRDERSYDSLSPRPDPDGALLDALRRRKPGAADRLVERFGDRAYRLAIRTTGNAEDAEEAVQDAFLSVIQRIDTFRGASALGSWIYRIVANASYQKLRGRARRRVELSLDEALPVFDQFGQHAEPIADWSPSLHDPARSTDLRLLLTAAMDELPASSRTLLVLRDVEGLSHREISDALGITVSNVKVRVHRARLFLRKRLEQHLVGGPDAHPDRVPEPCDDAALGDRASFASHSARPSRASTVAV